VQGTGIGLPMAKIIVEAHGGTIRVVNCVGRGCVFTFSLPAKRNGYTKHPERNMRSELNRSRRKGMHDAMAIRDEVQTTERRIASTLEDPNCDWPQ
jgi:hypothetical protein